LLAYRNKGKARKTVRARGAPNPLLKVYKGEDRGRGRVHSSNGWTVSQQKEGEDKEQIPWEGEVLKKEKKRVVNSHGGNKGQKQVLIGET